MRFYLPALLILALAPLPAHADDTLSLTLKDHKFAPAEIEAPAGKPLTIEIANEDVSPAEFESKQLRVEKVVAAKGRIVVKVRPLTPGRYRFYDDYKEDTTFGFVVVK